MEGHKERTGDTQSYQGREMLELMEGAANYNAFLLGLAEESCAGHRKILDFGAGVGTFSRRLRADGLEVDCVEPCADQRAQLAAVGFNVFESINDVPDCAYSRVFTLNVLEHIEDDTDALCGLHRVLKPAGRLFIYVPAMQVLYSDMDRRVGHYRRYSAGELQRKLRAAGFDIEKVRYTDILGALATIAYKAKAARGDSEVTASTIRFFDRFVFPLSKALSPPFGRIAGKNLVALARKPDYR